MSTGIYGQLNRAGWIFGWYFKLGDGSRRGINTEIVSNTDI